MDAGQLRLAIKVRKSGRKNKMNRGSFELSVSIPKDGRSTTIREFGNNGYTYVESREGQKFTLKIRNNSARRVLAVPSIDGLSTLDGEIATPQSRGYIVPAYSSVEIKGWRTSLEDVNDFVFERKESGKTYAAGTNNDTANCGVIAVMIFGEKQKPQPAREEHHHHHHHHEHYPWRTWYEHYPYRPYPPYPEIWCSTSLGGESAENIVLGDGLHGNGPVPMFMASTGDVSGNSAPSAPPPSQAGQSGMLRCMNMSAQVGSAEYTSDQKIGGSYSTKAAATPSFNMGTGFGAHQKDHVSEAQFERGDQLTVLSVYYTDAAALREIGIDVDKKVTINVMPQAFQSGFCKAPKASF
jgi:hypothetical protein